MNRKLSISVCLALVLIMLVSSTVTFASKKAPVEIRIPVFERGRQGQSPADTGYWAKYIQDKVLKDLNIKLTWVPIARPNPAGTKEAFNLLIASNTAPDIITEYDISPGYMGWYGQGVFQEVPVSLVKKYAPNYYKFVGPDIINIGKIKGKLIFLPAKRPLWMGSTWVNYIRQDWLDKLGLRNPRTLDEYYEVVKAFKTKDPGGVGPERVIGIPLDLNGATLANINYLWRPDKISDREKYLYSDVALPSLPWEPTRQALKWHNKAYNDGLINPEFMLDTNGEKMKAAFLNGYTGFWGEYITTDAGYIDTLMKNCPTAKLSVRYPYRRDEKVAPPYYVDTPPVGLMSGINRNCKHVPEVLKYLDWLSRPENLNVLQWGTEGKTYKEVNGVRQLLAYSGDERLLNGNNKDYYCLVAEGVDFGDDSKNLANAACPAGDQYRYLLQDSYKYSKMPYQKPSPNVFIPAVISAQSSLGPSLVTKYREYACRLIICKPSEFDALYEQYKAEYLAAGYQKILDEKAKIYDEWFGKKK
ncbi:MAG TPA: extracellular solute-binding protein [Bacillota bacterium]